MDQSLDLLYNGTSPSILSTYSPQTLQGTLQAASARWVSSKGGVLFKSAWKASLGKNSWRALPGSCLDLPRWPPRGAQGRVEAGRAGPATAGPEAGWDRTQHLRPLLYFLCLAPPSAARPPQPGARRLFFHSLARKFHATVFFSPFLELNLSAVACTSSVGAWSFCRKLCCFQTPCLAPGAKAEQAVGGPPVPPPPVRPLCFVACPVSAVPTLLSLHQEAMPLMPATIPR